MASTERATCPRAGALQGQRPGRSRVQGSGMRGWLWMRSHQEEGEGVPNGVPCPREACHRCSLGVAGERAGLGEATLSGTPARHLHSLVFQMLPACPPPSSEGTVLATSHGGHRAARSPLSFSPLLFTGLMFCYLHLIHTLPHLFENLLQWSPLKIKLLVFVAFNAIHPRMS